MMAQKGDISRGMTVADFITKTLKVPLDAPVGALVQAIKGQGQNATMEGKMGYRSSRPSPGMGRPQGPPMGGQPMGGEPQGLEDLLGV